MDEIIQKLKEFYKEKGVYFDHLNQFSKEAKEYYLNVNGDLSGYDSCQNNYKKVVQKIADTLGCETKFLYEVKDFAFDLSHEDQKIKVVYEDDKLELFEI